MNWMCLLLCCVHFFSFGLFLYSRSANLLNLCNEDAKATPKFLMIILSDRWKLDISFLQTVFSSGFLIKKLMDPNVNSFSFWHIVGQTWDTSLTHGHRWLCTNVVRCHNCFTHVWVVVIVDEFALVLAGYPIGWVKNVG